MESPVVNKPKVNITPKITKISSLAQSAEEIKRTSTKLRKTFESGTYQKKTQLTVLNRYKKRLDSIQKQNDKRFEKRQRVKIKLPEIKKYAGSLFTAAAGSDPLKTIGALAAFNALRKGAKGDILGALGPALVASGIFFGPSLINRGAGLLKPKGSPQKSPQIGAAGASAGSFWGTPYAETKAGKAYGGMRKFRNMPKWAQKLSSSSAGRFAASNERMIQGTANIGDRLRVGTRGMGMQGVGGVAEGVATSRPSISPRVGLLNAALFGLDFMGRKGEGQTNLQAGIGAGAGLGGALLGAAIGSALFPGAGTVAGFLIGAAFSTGGAMLGSTIADKLTGADRLKKQTEQQKKLVERKEGGVLTFGKSLDRYERVINKFEEFSKNFKTAREVLEITEGGSATPPPPPTDPYTGPVDKETFFPLPGGVLSTREVGVSGGEYGAARSYGGHSGQDIGGLAPGSPVVAWKTGKITYSGSVEAGDTILTIDHGNGVQSVYKHVVPTVPNGSLVYGGQQIASLFNARAYAPHLHFEVWKGSSHKNPNQELSASQRISSPMDASRAEQEYKKRSQNQPQLASPTPQPSQPPQGLSIGPGGFNVGGRPAASLPPRVTSPSRLSRAINQFTSYDPRGQMEQVIPVPVPIPQQQMMQGGASESMMLPGPSEQDLLNSFYKRVLLNTVA